MTGGMIGADYSWKIIIQNMGQINNRGSKINH